MSRLSCVAALAFLSAASAAIASPSNTSQQEARLIGAWQEGMTQKLAQGTPEQRAMARKTGLLGAIMVYKADHRFELYPPCGAKQADLRKIGMQSIPGTWKLSDAGELVLTVSNGKQSLTEQGKLQWSAGQMTWIGKDGRVLQKAGKYEGPLPPTC